MSKIGISRAGGVVTAIFDRPGKKNALDGEMYDALIAMLADAGRDPDIGAVVLGGAGGAFTAGNDLADFLVHLAEPRAFPALRFVRALAGFEKPLVAAVSGDAVGVGTTMLFHCDLVYAAPDAKFRTPFVDLGLVPEAAVSLTMPQRFGYARAAQYLLLGESFDAQDAFDLGLVVGLCDAEAVLGKAQEAAQRLATKPRAALLAARRLMRGDPSAIAARIEEEAELFIDALGDPQTKARMQAFFAQRKTQPSDRLA